ncbi:MAG: sulfotransferase [Opitutales bacterium]
MLDLFLKSLSNHLAWWFSSLWPGKHKAAPLGLSRLCFLLLGYPLFLSVQLAHWLGFLFDEILFSAYRKTPVLAPVFISGIPRSGTTFLHRALAAEERYTYFTTWEAALAPSITERKIIRLLAALDRIVGGPIKGLFHALLAKGTGDFNTVHQVGLDAPEEDYLALLPIGACFILLLAFPFSKELEALVQLERMPQNERSRLIEFYKRCLQKHLYCHPGKTLLSKNAAFATWCPALIETFPDAKILLCIREPDTALSSQLSSLTPARKLFGTDPDGRHTAERFCSIYRHAYQSLAELLQSTTPSQVAIIAQSDLKNDPSGTIQTALKQLAMPLPASLSQLPPTAASKHQHQPGEFSVDSQPIRDCMLPAYEALLRSDHRSTPTTH